MRYLENNRIRDLIISAGLISMIPLLRYIGLSYIVSSAFILLLFHKKNVFARAKVAFIYGINFLNTSHFLDVKKLLRKKFSCF